MALIDRQLRRFGLDRDDVLRLGRRALAWGVRSVADALREEVVVFGAEPVASPAPSPTAATAADVTEVVVDTDTVGSPIVDEAVVSQPAKAKVADDPTVARYGAAAWVDAQQEERASAPPASPQSTASAGAVLYDQVIDVLHTIYDPEIPVDIYELGLIYEVDVRDDVSVHVKMTLTSPNCPAAQSLPSEVEVKVSGIPGVNGAEVEVVFDPPWTPDLMSDEARLELNL